MMMNTCFPIIRIFLTVYYYYDTKKQCIVYLVDVESIGELHVVRLAVGEIFHRATTPVGEVAFGKRRCREKFFRGNGIGETDIGQTLARNWHDAFTRIDHP